MHLVNGYGQRKLPKEQGGHEAPVIMPRNAGLYYSKAEGWTAIHAKHVASEAPYAVAAKEASGWLLRSSVVKDVNLYHFLGTLKSLVHVSRMERQRVPSTLAQAIRVYSKAHDQGREFIPYSDACFTMYDIIEEAG